MEREGTVYVHHTAFALSHVNGSVSTPKPAQHEVITIPGFDVDVGHPGLTATVIARKRLASLVDGGDGLFAVPFDASTVASTTHDGRKNSDKGNKEEV
ncbi:MAG: hypothetical protein Q9208_004802 [Pyrenodesmia sp. 3 TL-2023]